jgi:hypothetical protein
MTHDRSPADDRSRLLMEHSIRAAAVIAAMGCSTILTAQDVRVKPAVHGLVSMGAFKFDGPSDIGTGNVIDKAMADVRACNAQHPEKPLAVRLRVWGGFKAPPWVLNLGGGPIKAVQIKLGVAQGATSIELWQDYGGFPTVPDAQLKRWAAMVEANKTR